MSLGQNISALRRKAGWKKSELAKKCEVSKERVCKWEKDSKKPSIGELVKLSNLFDVTVDELVQNGEAIYKKREDFSEKIFMMASLAINGLYNGYNEVDWIRESNEITAVKILYNILSKRFLSRDGKVYDEYLIKNSNEEERYKWVQFINGKGIEEKEGPFKDYIDGICEIDECFEKLNKEFIDKKKDLQSLADQRWEKEIAQLYWKIDDVVDTMKSHDKYSDQLLNKNREDLETVISKLDQESFPEKVLLLYCHEIEAAWDRKDYDAICKLSEESRALHDYIWKRIPV